MNQQLFPVKLREYSNRIEKLEEEKKELSNCIKSVYQKAENVGFDKKALKRALQMLKLEKKERENQLDLTSCYLEEIGE
ncbi:hypothetical protein Cva_00842 [Caedimonas varicaedens]|uniref:GapR-like DNA-binding domain-containing protein n=1 Tax=Caedimonas varicaedens TaxID=1629334 RepID=A0A0K8ME95_9PROT|nr:hypothetical protein Cva_00842 [Caedimonas varicaedens]